VYIVRFDPNPPYTRVILIGFLLFAEALLVNLLTILGEGRFPTQVEWATVICVGILQLVTYYLGFLRREAEG